MWENAAEASIETSIEAIIEIKGAYGRDRYKNMAEHEKNRLKEYQRNYKASKNSNNNFLVLQKNEWNDFKF